MTTAKNGQDRPREDYETKLDVIRQQTARIEALEAALREISKCCWEDAVGNQISTNEARIARAVQTLAEWRLEFQEMADEHCVDCPCDHKGEQ